jgi:hypothetical protein
VSYPRDCWLLSSPDPWGSIVSRVGRPAPEWAMTDDRAARSGSRFTDLAPERSLWPAHLSGSCWRRPVNACGTRLRLALKSKVCSADQIASVLRSRRRPCPLKTSRTASWLVSPLISAIGFAVLLSRRPGHHDLPRAPHCEIIKSAWHGAIWGGADRAGSGASYPPAGLHRPLSLHVVPQESGLRVPTCTGRFPTHAKHAGCLLLRVGRHDGEGPNHGGCGAGLPRQRRVRRTRDGLATFGRRGS